MAMEDQEIMDQEYLLMDKELIQIQMEPTIMNTAPAIATHMPVSLNILTIYQSDYAFSRQFFNRKFIFKFRRFNRC